MGAGAERGQLCELVEGLRLSNVRLLEKQPRERIPAFLAAVDACLVPLRNKEVFKSAIPSKMFEAMAAAKPVILGVEGEAKEILLASQAGLAVRPEDPEAMVAAILRLRNDPSLCQALGRNGRQSVLEKYLRRTQAAKYLNLLSELCARRKLLAADGANCAAARSDRSPQFGTTMKQLLQDLRTHEIAVEEVPAPGCQPGGVLVRTVASLISSGTERATVKLGSMSLLGKALERPDLVKSLVQRLRTTGVASVVATVRAKLDRAMALGYSAAGEILEVGEGAREFQVGQRVACAGLGYASHAERIWVPSNLCVPIPENVDYDSAAFVALGSIALQGVRVAEVKIGEHVAVLGLGLVGLVTAQILQAAGCTVWGVDPDPDRVALARELGVAFATSNSEFISEGDLPRAEGADAVIITAATKSNQPIDLAGQIARDRGVVVVVGDVRVDVPREHYYQKELQVRYSRSYGPGRYDPAYEEKGIDYPQGYVRWTEKRNMQAFLDLVAARKIDLSPPGDPSF